MSDLPRTQASQTNIVSTDEAMKKMLDAHRVIGE